MEQLELTYSEKEATIKYVLKKLWEKTKDTPGGKSAFADEVIKWYEIPHKSFFVNACIYKDNIKALTEYLERNK